MQGMRKDGRKVEMVYANMEVRKEVRSKEKLLDIRNEVILVKIDVRK
jgi:hypothetical protein